MELNGSHLLILAAIFIAVLVLRQSRPKDHGFGPEPVGPPRSNEPPAAPQTKAARKGRLPKILFLIVWLIGWTFGILMAYGTLQSGESGADWFLVFWLVAAVAGWFAAVYALVQLILGRSIEPDDSPED